MLMYVCFIGYGVLIFKYLLIFIVGKDGNNEVKRGRFF